MQLLSKVVNNYQPTLDVREIGTLIELNQGVAVVSGLPRAQLGEVLDLGHGCHGLALNLTQDSVHAVLLDDNENVGAGTRVRRTHRVFEVPTGDQLLSRVVDPLGRPLDGQGPIQTFDRLPVDREAPSIMDRAPVTVPLQTGIKVVDALVPIGRGQRELILGDRQTGKTSIAVDTILNQRGRDVVCIYCCIAQRTTSVARVVDTLRSHKAIDYSVVVVAEPDSPAGTQYIAPYAATAMGEWFMQQGRDVLIVYDDLTAHARAYRELSLLMRRPPAREAYPGDIFYLHSRLLERSTHLSERCRGGSLTALPIAETEAQNLSAYIPTNLISITDGQIYLSPELFRKGQLPAVDVTRSVSRVGGKTQLPAYRSVAGSLRLSYSQFEELEKFARFSSQLDPDTRNTLEQGRRVREILKQDLHAVMSVSDQIVELIAITSGHLTEVPLEELLPVVERIRASVSSAQATLLKKFEQNQKLSDSELTVLKSSIDDAILFATGASHGDT
ncbi:MAG: alternate F1F0 ATPase, F1 subunit alpha [Planctomycetaceae bacterium]